MEIEFYKKNVYGKENLYIKNKEQATIISGLTGKKTISEDDIENLEKLGLELNHVLA